MKANKLPDKMSSLIITALTDLEWVENSSRYKVDMGEWHTPPNSQLPYTSPHKTKCTVCFAGSVIAKSLGSSARSDRLPDDFDKNTENKLLALNELREGCVLTAAQYMEIELTPEQRNIFAGYQYNTDFPSYKGRRNQNFHKAMQDLAGILKSEGL